MATDDRIVKWYKQGCTIERIAKKLGRPLDTKRVVEGLKRSGLLKEGIVKV